MRNQPSKIKHQRSTRGFTIVECLVALAISAVLLTAVAVAFSASLTNYRENERMFRSLNGVRQALTRMTSEIRTAGYSTNPSNPDDLVGVDPLAPANECRLYTPAGELITYQFRDASYANPACRNKLYLVKNATNEEYVLCDNLVAATFIKTPTASPYLARAVQISLTVQNGGYQRTLSAAAVVRRVPQVFL